MRLRPSPMLKKRDVTRGLDLVIKEGLMAEAMSTLTGGTFLMAMAILLGASNFQIGFVAALPTITNIFQVVTTWLLQKYNNRRITAVIANGLARLPLLVIGVLPLLFSASISFSTIMFILVFHHLFGSIAGASWNSWMKDLVPDRRLGSFFSRRTSMTQTLNVCLSLTLALILDFVRENYPGYELTVYGLMFIVGAMVGLVGTWLLSKTPEPVSHLPKGNLIALYRKPLANRNFRKALEFQIFWSFALSLAAPFLTVFLLKNLNLNLSTVIIAGMCSQIAGIIAVKQWGRYADRFGYKNILRFAGPLYACCMLLWPVPAVYSSPVIKISLVMVLNIISGMASAGINLSLTNMAMKLAPRNEAAIYLTARSMIIAMTRALSPIAGAFLADFFMNKQLDLSVKMGGFAGLEQIRFIYIQNYGFLFLIAGALALLSLLLLRSLKEEAAGCYHSFTFSVQTHLRRSLRKAVNPTDLLESLQTPFMRYLRSRRRFRNKLYRRLTPK